jgi:hypothetical protein
MLQDLAITMEEARAAARAHILPCEACERCLEEQGLCCPTGEALIAVASAATSAYARQVVQQGQWN